MILLSDLAFNSEPPPERTAIDRIRAQFGTNGSGGHSLCELRFDEEKDYAWLTDWAKKLMPERVNLLGWYCGVLMMALFAEVARRNAKEGSLWSVLHGQFNERTRRHLFDANQQPRQELKDLLVEAASQLGLRHVFGMADAQCWYDSIFLQFGFTITGAREHMPEWLVGVNRTKSINLLLEDPGIGSRSFRRLWESMRYYRKDLIPEAQLRKQLSDSPWVLPSWVDEIVMLARRPGPADPDEHEDEQEIPLLENCHIEWYPPKLPFLACQVSNLAPLSLTFPSYRMRLRGETVASIFRQPDGEYRVDRPEVRLPCDLPVLAVTLMDPGGQIHATQTINAWNGAEDINLFTTQGRELGLDAPLESGKPFVLQVAGDLRVEPEPEIWRKSSGVSPRRWCLIQIESGASDLRVLDPNGTVLWKPQVGLRVPPPAWNPTTRGPMGR